MNVSPLFVMRLCVFGSCIFSKNIVVRVNVSYLLFTTICRKPLLEIIHLGIRLSLSSTPGALIASGKCLLAQYISMIGDPTLLTQKHVITVAPVGPHLLT